MKCKVGKICGGCAYLSKSMEEQASIKKAQVEELAQRNHLKLRVGDVLTAKNTTHYRNKVIVGFAKNKGYGTREHLEALESMGPTPIHRMNARCTILAFGVDFRVEKYNYTSLCGKNTFSCFYFPNSQKKKARTGNHLFPSTRLLFVCTVLCRIIVCCRMAAVSPVTAATRQRFPLRPPYPAP